MFHLNPFDGVCVESSTPPLKLKKKIPRIFSFGENCLIDGTRRVDSNGFYDFKFPRTFIFQEERRFLRELVKNRRVP